MTSRLQRGLIGQIVSAPLDSALKTGLAFGADQGVGAAFPLGGAGQVGLGADDGGLDMAALVLSGPERPAFALGVGEDGGQLAATLA